MSKTTKKLLPLVVLLIAALSVFLTACGYRPKVVTGGNPNAAVESNGGIAVKQGEHVYFVNGKTGFDSLNAPEDNELGNVLKGSIVRGKSDDKGNLSDFKTIVPKMILSSYTEQGFSIFGKWIYYVTPSKETNNKGVVQKEYLEYYRTSIDSTETEMIIRIKGQSLPYKFTAAGMYYYEDYSVKYVSYTDKKISDPVTIAEEVGSYYFPVSSAYDSNKSSLADNVFYTVNPEDENTNHNLLYTASGEKTTLLIDGSKYADTASDKKYMYSVSLKNAQLEGDKITLYYEKSNYFGGDSTSHGLHAYSFDSSWAFNKTNEKQISFTAAPSKFYPLGIDNGILDVSASEVVIKNIVDGKEISTKFKLSGTPTVLRITEELVGDKEIAYLYYLNGAALEKAPLTQDEDGKPVDHAAVIMSKNIDTSFFKPDLIGDKMYFINTNYYNYTCVGDLSEFDVNNKEEENSKIKVVFIGTMTEADIEQKEKDDKEKEKEDKK